MQTRGLSVVPGVFCVYSSRGYQLIENMALIYLKEITAICAAAYNAIESIDEQNWLENDNRNYGERTGVSRGAVIQRILVRGKSKCE